MGEDSGPFSSYLRSKVAAHHKQVERLGEFPARVMDVVGYADCLSMFQAIFAALEDRLATFNASRQIEIDFEVRCRSPALRLDLAALGRFEAKPVDLAAGPECFSEALGALYVLEGSTLGGKMILADISGRLGASIAGATRFFEGHGAHAGAMWLAFRKALDSYANDNAAMADRIVDGATKTFQLFADAMRARREGVFSARPVAFAGDRKRKLW